MRQALQSLTVFGASPAPREGGRSPLAAARMRESAASLMDAAIATVASWTPPQALLARRHHHMNAWPPHLPSSAATKSIYGGR